MSFRFITTRVYFYVSVSDRIAPYHAIKKTGEQVLKTQHLPLPRVSLYVEAGDIAGGALIKSISKAIQIHIHLLHLRSDFFAFKKIVFLQATSVYQKIDISRVYGSFFSTWYNIRNNLKIELLLMLLTMIMFSTSKMVPFISYVTFLQPVSQRLVA